VYSPKFKRSPKKHPHLSFGKWMQSKFTILYGQKKNMCSEPQIIHCINILTILIQAKIKEYQYEKLSVNREIIHAILQKMHFI